MITVYSYALSRYRGAIVGWGLALGLLGLYLLPFYDTLAEQKDTLEKLLASYPPELMAFFGDTSAMFTPEGYLGIEFFSYLPLILGIFAVLAGSGLLGMDEENGTLDLVLAHPVSRTGLFAGRVLAFVTATIAILALAWLGLAVGKNWSEIDVTWNALALPFLSLLAELLLFAAAALFLSMVLPSRRAAGLVAGLFLVASFFVTSLARLDENLEGLARLSPLNYYQSGEALLGLNVEWLVGLVAVATLLTVAAWWRFQRRDIRVAGEGSFGLRLRRRIPAARASR